jgi:hypothetical protein
MYIANKQWYALSFETCAAVGSGSLTCNPSTRSPRAGIACLYLVGGTEICLHSLVWPCDGLIHYRAISTACLNKGLENRHVALGVG